ncbi:paladin isoform X1 [Cynara cardunculus var. scolymus]|uniref:paladin isoform X1 n=1 Tax=Cynara cardunculus var. scolymus TaxID=59895 RepID=UPI000D626D11|nr:paladin isoform X1 [Cynara cardunculus var. scolymus]
MSIPKEPEQVMKQRDGSVLGKKTILKSDHFPGCQNKRLSPQIDGAPNYRQAESLHVHGVAIPTIDGIRNVLTYLGAQMDGKQANVLWINLREEPVVYINGRPFVLREVERPFSNLEYTGINRARVEQMEDRLREDILLEAARYGNKILVTDELPDGQMVDQWEPVTPESVKTPLQVYLELQTRQFLVDYERIPVTDEKSPKEQDFDILVDRISKADVKTEIIFNCQMGRGRTTTGMVIATLIYFNLIGASGIPRTNSIGKVSVCGSNASDNMLNTEEALRRGEYTVIRSLIRVLEGGVEGKRQVDKVIDKCASMQNLREAIATYRNSILRQPDEMKREALLSFFVEYLERYYYLICFAVYLHIERAVHHLRSPGHFNFYDWMKARPELYTIIRRLLRRDPMGALGYANLKPLNKITKSVDGHPCEMGIVAVSRTGEVLGSQTVLKSDHCPGCQQSNLPERVEGAPNFREIPGFPVYGVANPTVEGIQSVIQRICSSKDGRPVFWHNMREEPVIYINGKPFVLREVERPYKNMLEYTGIDRERVERMEARLKEDILRESERYEGDIMVIHETEDGEIFDAWEHVSFDVVQTPLEVFRSLEADGFPIKYARVPITDGKAPKSSDFDTLALNISSASKDTAFVFNCQMGRGRTTTGTVIACLLKLRIDYGRPIRILLDDVPCGELDNGTSSGDESGHYAESISSVAKGRARVDSSHAFGINDILLLWKITRFFENGVECREALDAVIDRCSALQNIRQAVLQYRKLFNQQHVEPRERRVALNRGAEYLERYFRLIAFAAYLGSEAFDGFCGQGEYKITFKSWLHQRPEVQAMKWSIRLRPGRFFSVPEELRAPQESQHGDAVMEAIVKKRNGSVLGKGSILKMYFFPGQRTSSHIQIHGAPHVYKVDGYPVYCMATPTIAGAKEMLAYLGARPTSEGNGPQKVILTDLREEAVVYINGTPFVLRELNKPVDTLKHVGITGSVVEHMEARLKEDIISEIRKCGGRMLLHREEYNPASNQASVVGYWENIFVEDVKTPTEVYAALRDDGYDITYRRIPLTREREALASDVDAIQYCMDNSAGSYLFVSHTGFGGVAYAMAIICIRLQSEGKLASHDAPAQAGNRHASSSIAQNFSSEDSYLEAREKGDYRDILSLTRVLVHGPESKSDVDNVIERCAGAGHLRDDILFYSKELEKFEGNDDDHEAYIMDMGIKALRRYFLLIMFRSYLYCTSAIEMKFTTWMVGRPELGHLCNNLRIDK